MENNESNAQRSERRERDRRLLIITQAVDTSDPILGFFHRWIEEFAKHCAHVHVICLKEGTHALPENVSVYSLGKERGRSRVKYVFRLYRYVWSLRNEYDAVFVHMNPEYVILCGSLWKLLGKRVGLWFVHRVRNWWIRTAVHFVDVVITSVPKSIGISSKKILAIGHGVDTAAFAACTPKSFDRTDIRLVTVGRITPIKRIETILGALKNLREKCLPARLDIIGEPVMEYDAAYVEKLKASIHEMGLSDCVTFVGSITNDKIPSTLNGYDISINASPTGGIDKTVLESALAGPLVVMSNRAFEAYFGHDAQHVLFKDADALDCARIIESLLMSPDREDIRKRMRETVEHLSNVTVLVPRILHTIYGSN